MKGRWFNGRFLFVAAMVVIAGTCFANPIEKIQPSADTIAPMNIAAPSDTAEPEATVAIRAFLKNYVKPLLPEIDKSTRFAAYAIPGTDVTIVFVSGFSWCGTGGCELLILRGGPSALKLMDSKPIVHPPIRVLNTQSAGLPDIGFWKGGGGGPSYEAVIHFNGKHYGPAKRLKGPPSGRIVIPDEKDFGILLYE